jgi:multicomponent Na+:H+ antiporter subunit E
MIVKYFVVPIPLTLGWVIMTNQYSLAAFAIGYVLTFVLNYLLIHNVTLHFSVTTIPAQLAWLVIYVGRLIRDIFLSGVDVALRVLGFRPLKPGIIAVSVQDKIDDKDRHLLKEIIAGLSAHSITITPGELVVDFDEEHDMLYVHCLDVDKSLPHLDRRQAERAEKFRRILGQ